MTTREQARDRIAQLVDLFLRDRQTLKSDANYKEDRVRRDFIDPFFKALGWDINNEQGLIQAYRDVISEDKISVGGKTKAPDYAFRIGGNRVFFVEAKKPSVNIREDQDPAFQLRRYGWSAKLPLSLLTDFEEFAIYDCRQKPNPTDKAATCRLDYLTCEQYLERFDFLYDTFAKDAVLRGSLVRYAQADTQRRGTASVDDEFLAALERWRDLLAKSIRKADQNLDEGQLTAALQKTLDRIVFLRICEDRGLEPPNQLTEAAQARKDQSTYQRLYDLFRKADAKYNSGLFDLANDPLTASLALDDKTLQIIVRELYYPDCPYEFSVIPVEILGHAYERFLGKVIRFTPKGLKTEEKPEVRKAGGVFYTPQYIVDYIVAQTLGPLVEGKTPDDLTQLSVLDPACGSGSFLLGAYQFLLDWHRRWFEAHPEVLRKAKSPWKDALLPDGSLATRIKKNILTNNIFGVDLDSNAVEVTKLSLMLKALEGETTASVNHQLSLTSERVLPTLDRNIIAGNSLVGPDFADELDFDPAAEKKVKPFHWQRRFAAVFARGGFDAVVGNPPYVRQELLTQLKSYFQRSYRVYDGKADLYAFFIEKGIDLLRPGGRFSVIVANKWMRAAYGRKLREWLLNWRLTEITDFGDLPVFSQATTYPCILSVQKVPADPAHAIPAANLDRLDFADLAAEVAARRFDIRPADLDPEGWSLMPATEAARLRRIRSVGIPLGEYVNGKIYYGIKTGLNEAFVVDGATRDRLVAQDPRSAELLKPFLAGRDIKRYQRPQSDKWLIFTRQGVDIDQYPAIKAHLLQYKDRLMPKPKTFKGENWKGRKPGSYQWYEIQDTIAYYAEFEREKIIVPAITKQPELIIDSSGFYSNDKTTIIGSNCKYLLGILNSSTSQSIIASISSTKRGGYFEWKPMYLSQIPIKVIDPSNPREVELKGKIESAVEELLGLGSGQVAGDRERMLDRAAYLEERIDGWVAELYGV